MRKTAFILAATMLVAAQVFAGQSYDNHTDRVVSGRHQIKEAMKKYGMVRYGRHATA